MENENCTVRIVLEKHGKLWHWTATYRGEEYKSGKPHTTAEYALQDAHLYLTAVDARLRPAKRHDNADDYGREFVNPDQPRQTHRAVKQPWQGAVINAG